MARTTLDEKMVGVMVDPPTRAMTSRFATIPRNVTRIVTSAPALRREQDAAPPAQLLLNIADRILNALVGVHEAVTAGCTHVDGDRPFSRPLGLCWDYRQQETEPHGGHHRFVLLARISRSLLVAAQPSSSLATCSAHSSHTSPMPENWPVSSLE